MAQILVIDDDPRYRRLIARILEQAGHQVSQAGDGDEGLAVARDRHPALVITDLVMPGKEGIETIIELARENPGIAVLAISGAAPAALYLKAATSLGATASLAKPFSSDQLLARVAELLPGEPL